MLQSSCLSRWPMWCRIVRRQVNISNRILCQDISYLHTPMCRAASIELYKPTKYCERNFLTTHAVELIHDRKKNDTQNGSQSNSDLKIGNDVKQEDESITEVSQPSSTEEKPGIFIRFRQTYRQYGKLLVGVHVVTSTVWISTFYYIAVSGIDVVPLLEWFGASEKVITSFAQTGGHAAVTYLMYKLASPLRYTVTVGLTHFTGQYLRHLGYLPPITDNERIRSLMKEKYDDLKDRKSKDHKQD